MADGSTQSTPAGQAPASGQPQAGIDPTPQAGAGTPQQQSPSTPASGAGQASKAPDEYERIIAELRKEQASNRVELKQFREAQAAADAAKLSDLEKAQKRSQDAEAALAGMRQRIGASELKMAAQAAGIIDADVAAAMLGAKVEYDAQSGEPTNVADLVAGLKKDKPHLFGGGQQQRQQSAPHPSSGGATNPGRAAGNAGLTLEQIRAMPMRERIARMDEITAWEKAQQQQR